MLSRGQKHTTNLERDIVYPALIWWASRESNTVPTDYESAALTNMS